MLEPLIALEVFVAPLTPRAILPQKTHPLDAGFDLAMPEDCVLLPYDARQIDLGFAVQIPPGWYGQVFGRSSVFCRGLSVHPGVIDAEYRGAVQLLVYNRLRIEQPVQRGERLAQLLFLPVPVVTLTTVTPDNLSHTVRGAGGLGSTGR
jgi:dUTP pyrophosphatase